MRNSQLQEIPVVLSTENSHEAAFLHLTLLQYQLDLYEPSVLALGRVLGKNSF